MKKHLKEAVELVERGLDKNVRISVTGLSRAGKTAFITSFINQILHHKDSIKLPFWMAHAEKRIVASKITRYPELHIPEFAYNNALEAIKHQQWPESTTNISQIRLSIKFNIKNRWIKKILPASYLHIDIVDYPGEWLLDLPMLNMSYAEWSEQFYHWLAKAPQNQLANGFLVEKGKFKAYKDFDEETIKEVSNEFKKLLSQCKQSDKGIHFIQPGRFVLPGDLVGAPVLDFFPFQRPLDDSAGHAEDSNYAVLEKRYNYYRDKIIKPFFTEYFAKVDRQILIVDCLQVLNQGQNSYLELKQTLSKLITSFNYGQSNWFKRMFRPNIDKLLIAASKSDHVPPEQHSKLHSFLSKMLTESENLVGYQGVDVDTVVFSSISCTEAVLAEQNSSELACVKGVEMETGKAVVNYPGAIPESPMSSKSWDAAKFDFVNFAIPEINHEAQLPHQRMDRVIEKLIGDKFI